MASVRRRSIIPVLLVAAALGGCSARHATPVASGDGRIQVVAAEGFWGSIAAQLGGDRVAVTNLIDRPGIDPHDYEPTARDGRALARARYVVVNGLGYDTWAVKAVGANPSPQRHVLEVGRLLGLPAGANPHRWYFPADVARVVQRITADYQAIDPAHSAEYEQLRQAFESTGLAPYHELLAQIRDRYAGTPVGASESLFAGLAEAAGLDLVTPPSFLSAMSRGDEPRAGDKQTVESQLAGRHVAVFVVNRQNATPDVQRLVDAAEAHRVQVTAMTETPPAGARFQDWQTDQLRRLAAALAEATGR